MGNSIYYNEEEAATKALRVGGFSIGTGDVDKGPTNTTSFFNSIDPPSGGYTIYLNKSGNQGPSIRVASNDANLILITNQISGNSYTTVTQCLQYFQGQTDKMVINRTIGAVVTEGLQQYYDFGNSICYGGVGGVATLESSCKNMVDGASATINNVSEGLSFNSANEGYFEWDGTTTSNINTPDTGNMSLFSLDAWVYNVSGGNGRHSIFRDFWEIVGTSLQFWSYSFDNDYWRATGSNVVPYNTWTHVCTTWDGTYIRHYANGSLVYTQPTASGGTSENMYQIAGYSGRAFYGRIGTLAVYTKTLNAAEVLQNYNANSSRF